MELIREQTVAFTGSRALTTSMANPNNVESTIRTALCSLLEECYNRGKRTFLSGMAIGWDMICAEEVLKLREKYHDIRLISVIPFEGQEERFSQRDKTRYHELLTEADDTIIITTSGYNANAYHKRNDFLVKNSSEIIAYDNGKPRSGTSSTINKAKKNGLKIHNLCVDLQPDPVLFL
ncbi:MAG: SLOG family protein [Rikenellaceae bacterium]